MLCPLGKDFPCGIQDVNSYASTNVCFAILSPYQVPNLARQILLRTWFDMLVFAIYLGRFIFARSRNAGGDVVNRLENTIGSYDVYLRYRFDAPNHQIRYDINTL